MIDYKVTYRKKDKKVQCIINYKINGRWKQKASQKYTTQKEYKDWIRKTVKEIEESSSLETVDEYKGSTLGELVDVFLEHQKLYKEPKTIKNYMVSLNLLNNLYQRDISSIKKHDIQSIIDYLIDAGAKSSTIKVYTNIMSLFFNYLIKDLGLLSKNPCKELSIPKSKDKIAKRSLNYEEIVLLLDKLKDDRYFIVYYIALNTGMRFGEILGLTWGDIDYKNNVIHVNKQWKILKNGKQGFGDLKSKNSNRSIPVSKEFINKLTTHKNENPVSIDNRIMPINRHILTYIDEHLKKIIGITMHELRHTYATRLIASGVDFKTVAKILGHEVEQTLRTYSHVTDDMMKNASNIISKIFIE